MSGAHAGCGRFLPGTPVAERFWAKVDMGDGAGCWLWIGARNRDGYGHISINATKRATASRVAWELHHGPIPTGMLVCHSCDTPRCVRPDHLFLGTHGDNARDCFAKGRRVAPMNAGERNPARKLSLSDVSGIRRRLAAGEKRRAVAMAYGVSPSQIFNIAHGVCWATRDAGWTQPESRPLAEHENGSGAPHG